MTPLRPFDWHDAERRIHFGRGRLDEAVTLVGGPGYSLLTTERASAQAPHVADAAAAVVHVPPGLVDELAGDLLDVADDDRLVALGGGRVVDVAKAIVAARGGLAAAIPTTLSGAEMTRTHRRARGAPPGSGSARPAIVVADPALMASQPPSELAASALNAMGHAVEGPCTTRSNPIAVLTGDEAARLLTGAFAGPEPDRDSLALGALLAGYAIDSAGYGLHHVVCQTLVRVARASHAGVNAIMLAHTFGALERRFPERAAGLAAALGEDPAQAAYRICALTGTTRLRDLGVERPVLEQAAENAAKRTADLAMTPPPADMGEILALYEAAL